jgi:hypothetical protein
LSLRRVSVCFLARYGSAKRQANLPRLLLYIQIHHNTRVPAFTASRCGIAGTDPFTLQYVAGHDNIKTTMRYVHPREAAVHKLFARLAELQQPEERVACKRSVQNPVQFEMPSENELAKLLIAGNLQSAEVVELADTPS